ncbi:bifunctional acetate--CoA ligase family protein/GNAT family N-acetyltransferase [Pseudohalioglobus sediminis]|uniref:Bifunctional acetate--CoA ligase family protein/GNAT family N-acetyltransferase n=1 Tax=Pseudohalioglobus sediminis TaxID=2606449 RepID=A0A5B0WQ58_9GAMM|nr:bifunctional acetate--CoA ligase family protein/GNAT family N-acetyltransferase [Pseudohalioglobus sediminis]KAA1189152.1 bifunctional acetate--CoA ligase family protein/GNAT family N-acetyltransferase [Pseudohalioglobus sediminis]
MSKHYLESVFSPASVAVVCDSTYCGIGLQVLHNLRAAGYQGAVHAVMPDCSPDADIPARACIADVDGPVELAVIAARAEAQPGLLRECGERKVRAAIVLSGGFTETQERGLALQNELVDIARAYDIALVGPRCLGVVRPVNQLNVSSARSPVARGKVALVTQSGAFCSALLDWADSNNFGFSAVASLGASSAVKLGDMLDYLAQDPHTNSILLYVERITDARLFLSGLRAAARLKPVVVIKSGRNESGKRAALGHIHTPLGSDEVFDAAIRRAGAVRVTLVSQLIAAATILATGARVKGSRLAVLTNGGGPGVMAADWAGSEGVPLAPLAESTVEALSAVLPAHWSHCDPVDILGDADGERYRAATEIILRDENVDGLLVLCTPQGFTDPDDCAQGVIDGARGGRKPVLASWMGERLVAAGRKRLTDAGIPHFIAPEGGVDAFAYLASYRRNQSALLQVPEPLSENDRPDIYGAQAIIDHALAERREILTLAESKAILRAFKIPVLPSINAHDAVDALVAAENLGLPVAMKINSPDILHKSDVGGVRLNIRESRSIYQAYEELTREVAERVPEARIQGVCIEPMIDRPHAREMMVAIARDPVFGPVIHLGAAGTAIEMLSEGNQVALPPLNDFLSRELIDRTQASRFLRQFRSFPEANLGELSRMLQRVSEIACELPSINTLDINPLLVDEDGVVAVGARITVKAPAASTVRYGHMAIHPYPANLESNMVLADGLEVLVRPIRPEDARKEQDFVTNLSAQSKYFRFMHGLNKLTPEMLARFTQIDYDREMALVAIAPGADARPSFLGVARYTINPDGSSCEFALTVADAWQGRGVGPKLMERLMHVARERGLDTMIGEVLSQNARMLRMCKQLGFRAMRSAEDPEVTLVTRSL